MEKWIENLSTPNNAQNYFSFLISFKTALAKVITKFGNNIITKSDSWMSCDIDYLNRKLTKNYNEYIKHSNLESLTDTINYSIMLLERSIYEDKIDKNSEYGKLVTEHDNLKSDENSKYGKLLKKVIGDIEV